MLFTWVLLLLVLGPFVAMLLDVHMQIAWLGKSLSTVFTDVWFLSGVCVYVNLELECQSKKRMAVWALELLLRRNAFSFYSFLCVQLRMNA